jgi:uncharacterized membrane protein
MNQYPEVVLKIVNDYLERVKAHLRMLPALEQHDFVLEIQSHLYDAYEQTPGSDDVARILAVLRNFGEPADVVAERLPGTMVRNGTRKNLPLYIIGGIAVAFFGLPLGFGGFGILIGFLAALAALLVAYFTFAGALAVAGTVVMSAGLMRFLMPELWHRLTELGYIQMSDPLGEFLESLPASDAGLLMMLFAAGLLGASWGLFRGGKHLLRGLRFLFTLIFDWMRRFAQSIRRKLRRDDSPVSRVGSLSFVPDK